MLHLIYLELSKYFNIFDEFFRANFINFLNKYSKKVIDITVRFPTDISSLIYRRKLKLIFKIKTVVNNEKTEKKIIKPTIVFILYVIG